MLYTIYCIRYYIPYTVCYIRGIPKMFGRILMFMLSSVGPVVLRHDRTEAGLESRRCLGVDWGRDLQNGAPSECTRYIMSSSQYFWQAQ